MPLNSGDRRFISVVERLKVYVLLIAIGIFAYLVLVPSEQIQTVSSVLGMALCAVFWLTQRLLSFITQLDVELTRVINVVKRTLPEAERKQLFPDR